MEFMLCRTLTQFLSEPLAIVGLILLSVGIAIAFLSRRIARVARQKNEISESDKVYVTFKIIGLVMVVVGFSLIIADIMIYIFLK
jgi:uncharacterized protein YjeT (DUF2065 family)